MSQADIVSSVVEALRHRSIMQVRVAAPGGMREFSIEPYSMRERGRALFLFGWLLGAGRVAAIPVSEIQDIRATGQTFDPRYLIEVEEAPLRGAA